MRNDVITVKPLPGHRINVELESGRCGVFGLTPCLDHGVFGELKDTACFNRVGVLYGAVTWPHQQDLAPETLLAGLTLVHGEAAWN